MFGFVSPVPGHFKARPDFGISHGGVVWGSPAQAQKLDFKNPCGSLPAQDLLGFYGLNHLLSETLFAQRGRVAKIQLCH